MVDRALALVPSLAFLLLLSKFHLGGVGFWKGGHLRVGRGRNAEVVDDVRGALEDNEWLLLATI